MSQRLPVGEPRPHPANRDWDERETDDGDDDEREVLLHGGDAAKEVAEEEEDRHPERASDAVAQEEGGVVHAGGSGYERGTGADEGEEACNENRPCAVALEEGLRLQEMVLVDPA